MVDRVECERDDFLLLQSSFVLIRERRKEQLMALKRTGRIHGVRVQASASVFSNLKRSWPIISGSGTVYTKVVLPF
jgi:hypothetical protein